MKPKQPLLIFPYNGNGLEALDCIDDSFLFLGFVDDTPEKLGQTSYGHQVFGREAFTNFPDALVLAVPGSPDTYRSRGRTINGLGLKNERFAKVIHPNARVSPMATFGNNLLIMAGVVITSNAIIGSHCCILPNTVIHHDVKIGDRTLIGASVTIAGSTVVEENCYIGSGSTLKNGLRVGARALIGMGSNVIRNVNEDTRVVGNPARELIKTDI
ncbi:MAG: acetyltransferase [Methylococcaceae bacterium]|nr:acetyltransferase [Methylococcaceae bacterium]